MHWQRGRRLLVGVNVSSLMFVHCNVLVRCNDSEYSLVSSSLIPLACTVVSWACVMMIVSARLGIW